MAGALAVRATEELVHLGVRAFDALICDERDRSGDSIPQDRDKAFARLLQNALDRRDAGTMEELFRIRIPIEVSLFQQLSHDFHYGDASVQSRVEDGRERLLSTLEGMHLCDPSDSPRFLELDLEFHAIVAESCGFTEIGKFVRELRGGYLGQKLIEDVYRFDGNQMPGVAEEHRKLFDAIFTCDIDDIRIEQLVTKHICGAKSLEKFSADSSLHEEPFASEARARDDVDMDESTDNLMDWYRERIKSELGSRDLELESAIKKSIESLVAFWGEEDITTQHCDVQAEKLLMRRKYGDEGYLLYDLESATDTNGVERTIATVREHDMSWEAIGDSCADPMLAECEILRPSKAVLSSMDR